MIRPERLIATLLLVVAAASVHAALTLDRSEPISIEADSAVIDEPSGSAIYRGRVLLRQGGVRLEAGELTLFIQDGKAVKAIAAGTPVRLEQAATPLQEAIQAEARRITFLIAENRMVLENQARLRQGDRLFQGANIDYDLNNRRVNASGGTGSRVLLVLPPTESSGGGTPAAP